MCLKTSVQFVSKKSRFDIDSSGETLMILFFFLNWCIVFHLQSLFVTSFIKSFGFLREIWKHIYAFVYYILKSGSCLWTNYPLFVFLFTLLMKLVFECSSLCFFYFISCFVLKFEYKKRKLKEHLLLFLYALCCSSYDFYWGTCMHLICDKKKL